MKTLSTLALLTAATAAQAYTLDVNVGHSKLDNYDSVSLIGLGVGSHLNNEFHLGLNVGRKNISSDVALVDAKATSATLDLTYSLSPTGGIRPFVGAGVGAVRFTGDSIFTKNALSTKFFIGLAFPIRTSSSLFPPRTPSSTASRSLRTARRPPSRAGTVSPPFASTSNRS
jgi:outer membrane protein W